MENIVYNELILRGYNVDIGIIDIYDKNQEGRRIYKQLEVDFVVNQGSQRYYIQVAYSMDTEEKQTQELKSFRNISDSFKKIVIVNGTLKPWRNEEGFVKPRLHNRLHQNPVPQTHFLYPCLLFLIKIVAEHIALFEMEVVEIIGQLLLAALIVGISAPYF